MLCVVTLLVVCSLTPAWSVIVDTKYGQVQGETLTLEDIYFSGTEIDTFLSIPFAKPPLGEKRFLVRIFFFKGHPSVTVCICYN